MRPLNLERLQELNLPRMEQIYRDRLSDATDLTFLFVGTVDLNTLKPLVEQWIGSLPASGRKETGKDVGPKMLTGRVDKTVKKGIAPQSNTLVLMMGDARGRANSPTRIISLGELLEMRLLDRLREVMGGTYGVSVSASISRAPRQEWQVAIQYGSSPDRADALYKAVLEEMDSLKLIAPSTAEVERVREQQRRELEVARKQNGYWISALSTKLQFGDESVNGNADRAADFDAVAGRSDGCREGLPRHEEHCTVCVAAGGSASEAVAGGELLERKMPAACLQAGSCETCSEFDDDGSQIRAVGWSADSASLQAVR